MINQNEILTRLKNGETADAIAQELINALNGANEVYEAEKAEAKAKEANQKKKVDDLQAIMDLLHDFCIEYYCDDNDDIDIVHEAFNQFTPEDVIQMVEEIGDYAGHLIKMQNSLETIFGTKPSSIKINIPKDAVPTDTRSVDAVIDSFLKGLNLK